MLNKDTGKDSFCHKKYKSMLLTGTFTMAVNYLMLLCDNILAGLILGTDAVAAINLVTPLTGVVFFLACCITGGVSTLYSRAIGEADRRRADELFGFGTIVTAFLVIVVPVLLFLIRGPYFAASGMSERILSLAGEYYRLRSVPRRSLSALFWKP